MQHEQNQTDNQSNVNESTSHVKCEKPKQPKNDQDCGDYSKHVFISLFPIEKGPAIACFRAED
jgi:hypothetical protein